MASNIGERSKKKRGVVFDQREEYTIPPEEMSDDSIESLYSPQLSSPDLPTFVKATPKLHKPATTETTPLRKSSRLATPVKRQKQDYYEESDDEIPMFFSKRGNKHSAVLSTPREVSDSDYEEPPRSSKRRRKGGATTSSVLGRSRAFDFEPEESYWSEHGEVRKEEHQIEPPTSLPESALEDYSGPDYGDGPPVIKRRKRTEHAHAAETPKQTPAYSDELQYNSQFPDIYSSVPDNSIRIQPSSPVPEVELSFGSLVEENSILKAHNREFESTADKFLIIAASVGEIAFSNASESEEQLKSIRNELSLIKHPAAEACDVLLLKLSEMHQELGIVKDNEEKLVLKVGELENNVNTMRATTSEAVSNREPPLGLQAMKSTQGKNDIKKILDFNKSLIEAQEQYEKTITELTGKISWYKYINEEQNMSSYRAAQELGEIMSEFDMNFEEAIAPLEGFTFSHKSSRIYGGGPKLKGKRVIGFVEDVKAAKKAAEDAIEKVIADLEQKHKDLAAHPPPAVVTVVHDNLEDELDYTKDLLEQRTIEFNQYIAEIEAGDNFLEVKKELISIRGAYNVALERLVKNQDAIKEFQASIKSLRARHVMNDKTILDLRTAIGAGDDIIHDECKKELGEAMAALAAMTVKHDALAAELQQYTDFTAALSEVNKEKLTIAKLKVKCDKDIAETNAKHKAAKDATWARVLKYKEECAAWKIRIVETTNARIARLKERGGGEGGRGSAEQEAEIAKLKDEITKANDEIAKLKDEITKANDEIAKAKDEADGEAAKAKDEVAKAKDEVAKAIDEVTKAKDEAAKLEDEIAMAKDEVAKAKAEAAEAEAAAKAEADDSVETKKVLKVAEEKLKILKFYPELLPSNREFSDGDFAKEWERLYINVMAFCTINYSARSGFQAYDYTESRDAEDLLSIYIRDAVICHNSMVDSINDSAIAFLHDYRTKVAAAIIFRILVEEIFDPIRYLLSVRFQDTTQRWKKKSQLKKAWEAGDLQAAAPKAWFEERDSWVLRNVRGRDNEKKERSVEQDERLYRKKKRLNFNYFKEIEKGEKLNNADIRAIKFSKSKLMMAMFSSINDTSLNQKTKELRSNVSALIRDTLLPLRLPRDADSEDPEEPYNNYTLKSELWVILKQALEMALNMSFQPTTIYADTKELLDMVTFNESYMTDIEQPEDRADLDRELHDVAVGFSVSEVPVMDITGKVEIIVQPALVRKGEYKDGVYKVEPLSVISKAKVFIRIPPIPDPEEE